MLGLLALVTASIFFGAAVYINIAEHPARLGLPDGAALAEWGPAYRRGFAMQAPIAVVSALVGAAAWWTTVDPLWAAWRGSHDCQLAVHAGGYHADQSSA